MTKCQDTEQPESAEQQQSLWNILKVLVNTIKRNWEISLTEHFTDLTVIHRISFHQNVENSTNAENAGA